MNILGDKSTSIVATGTQYVPSSRFWQEPSTGPFLDNPGSSSAYTISKRGVKRLRITDTGVEINGTTEFLNDLKVDGNLTVGGITSGGSFRAVLGISTVPAYSFTADTKTGMYHNTSTTQPTLNFSVSGTQMIRTGTDGSLFSGVSSFVNGTVTTPSIAFNGDLGCGLFHQGSPSAVGITGGSLTTPLLAVGTSSSTFSTPVILPDGLVSAPSISFGADQKTGFYHQPSPSILSVTTGGNTVCNFGTASVSVSNTVPLLSGSQVSTGSFDNGTNSMNTGALSCLSITSTRYSIRLSRTATQSLTSGGFTAISWDTIETLGGGTSNWTVSVPTNLVTIPIAGTYLVVQNPIVSSTVPTGVRLGFIEHNNGGTPNGSLRRYAEATAGGLTGMQNTLQNFYFYTYAAGDTLQSVVYITVAGDVIFGNSPTDLSTLQITRLY